MSKQKEKEFFDYAYSSGVRGQAVGKVYSIIDRRNDEYERLIYTDVEGKEILEYGCGEGSHSVQMARRGAKVTGIDISEVGIQKSAALAEKEGLDNVTYLLMDAEKMTFPDESFDVVIGEAILHHLDLETSYREIARVLKPGGQAIFMEPLGHNPAINMFRNRTPHLRTPDEHPLVRSDLKMARDYFQDTEFQYHHLFSFASIPLMGTRLFRPTLKMLDKLDAVCFKVIPGLGSLSWYAIMILKNPKK